MESPNENAILRLLAEFKFSHTASAQSCRAQWEGPGCLRAATPSLDRQRQPLFAL
jgi:hypothetical protein